MGLELNLIACQQVAKVVHNSGSWLPLVSARPVVAISELHNRGMSEQPAQGCCPSVWQPAVDHKSNATKPRCELMMI